ncbi:SusC/RagA family TonB-linked outer membrane protein [Pedobacter nyackensis]|uniref:TonB-linked outer membrane protein, SusC/RagA family n=1 Tax=Pedobacter nyackensis TaxID=475255 RepID=A0A1W2CKW0_9SPHI|nr:TonB-dependent receptor [Pedobacter nyackensis]SMC85865.1 TonB-linked outer membrane protein, SusC/RagA family [Pedobacter nyackensis]
MKKYTLFVFIYLACVAVVYGQQRKITGTVTDQTGPLPGALVYEKELTSNGDATTNSGSFSLTLKGSTQVIVVKMVGYLSQEINMAGKSSVNVRLLQDTKGLEEVVVVGFGTKSKITNTGAISQISGAEIRQNPSASIQNTLMGRLPGFTSQQRSGQPGSDASGFSIRGANSYLGAVTPLVIVDDVEYPLALSDLDADQIESVTILKDASTLAVYGVKGANGVVLITTRRGQLGKPQISFRSEAGAQTPTFPLKFLNSYETAVLANQAATNVSAATMPFSDEAIAAYRDGTDPYGYPDVDWSETILKKHSTQIRNNLNISGGTEKAKYFVTIGQLYQNGIMKDFSTEASEFNSNYYYKRYNFRSNIDIKATKEFTVSVDLSGYTGEQNTPWLRGTANNPFFELNDYARLPPFAYPVYNPDGSYGGNNSAQLARLAYNVVGRMTHLGYQRKYSNGIMANISGKLDLSALTNGLFLKGLFGYSTAHGYNRNLTRGAFPSFVYDSKNDSYAVFDPATTRMPKLDLAYTSDDMIKRMNMQASLNYDRTFKGSHHVYGLVLTNFFANEAGENPPANFRGYSFRTGYDFNKKYIAEFTAGYNGTDKFLTDNRYAFFPAGSVGWNLSEERFFKKTFKFIDLLKIRASYGLLGNDDVGTSTYAFEQIYTRTTGAYSFGESAGSTTANAARLNEGTLENLNVRWELERSANIGVDLNAFRGKFKMSADVFNRYRYNILRARQSIPVYAGVAFPISNNASLRMKGVELDATYRDRIGQLNFSVNGNVSVAKSKIVKADEAAPIVPWQAQTGGYLGRVLGYVSDGFYKDDADVASSPKPAGIIVAPGDLKYKDLDGDGIIDQKDRIRLEYPNMPNTIYGLNFGLSYKGFSMALTLQAATNFTIRSLSTQIVPFIANLRSIHQDAWTPENQDAALPRLMPSWIGTVNDPNTYVSDFWNKRGDYLRIKSAEIAYDIPKEWAKGIYLNGLRIYANGNNLYTWMLKDKNIYNLDPESASGSAIQAYPQQKIFNLGLQVTF